MLFIISYCIDKNKLVTDIGTYMQYLLISARRSIHLAANSKTQMLLIMELYKINLCRSVIFFCISQ